MKKIFITIVVIVAIVIGLNAIAVSFKSVDKPITESVDLTGVRVISNPFTKLHHARTEAEKEVGLGKYKSLPAREAMLFHFNEENFWQIWMKDMKISIDIVWLTKDLIVVDIAQNISPDTYPTIYTPQGPAMYVLEMNANVSEELGLEVGNKLDLGKI